MQTENHEIKMNFNLGAVLQYQAGHIDLATRYFESKMRCYLRSLLE
jgi:hypothetical protein